MLPNAVQTLHEVVHVGRCPASNMLLHVFYTPQDWTTHVQHLALAQPLGCLRPPVGL